MIIELEKLGLEYSIIKPYYQRGICTRFVRRVIGSTRGINKVKVTIREKNPKNPLFTKCSTGEKDVVINKRTIDTHADTNWWLKKNVNKTFWFKIESIEDK
tara:strand:- start:1484 stop:1786 length:303 start_codon:yes stop_codon:yes gene_type:complete